MTANGISWFLADDDDDAMDGTPATQEPVSATGAATAAAAATSLAAVLQGASPPARRSYQVEGSDGVDLIDIEDEDHSFASFYVEMDVSSVPAQVQNPPFRRYSKMHYSTITLPKICNALQKHYNF